MGLLRTSAAAKNMAGALELLAGPLLVLVCAALVYVAFTSLRALLINLIRLFGTFIAQVYFYYITYPADRSGMKYYVFGLRYALQ